MGIEGISAKLYWECYRTIVKDNLFLHRKYHPSSDIVNATLNLGYSFLANEISTQLSAYKLDLELGFIHSISYGRNSLVLDMMEEFRAVFIDNWVAVLFNKHLLNANCFKGADENFYLTDEGFKKFCKLYNEHLEEKSWTQIFKTQAEKLKNFIVSEAEYEPYKQN